MKSTQDLSHLPYSSFLACLDDITVQHPNVRKIAEAAAAAVIEEGVATLATSIVVRPESGSGTASSSRPGTTGTTSGTRRGTGTGSGSRPGTAKGTANRAGESSRNHPTAGTSSSRGAGSPRRADRISSAASDGENSKGEQAMRRKKNQSGAVTATNHPTEGTGRLDGAGAKKVVGGVTTTVAAAAEKKEILSPAGFRPDDQRLLVFLQQYVFVNSQAGREVSQYTESRPLFPSDTKIQRLKFTEHDMHFPQGHGKRSLSR